MIKLIASDMDGTLLDEHSKVPPETFELIEALREKGVHFAVSSGRRYDRLCTFFEPVREVDKDLPNAERIWDLPDPEVNLLKASIFCDDGNVMDNAYVLQRELGDKFVFAPSGNAWIDALQLGVTKASGIAQIMGHYGIKTEEVMAFGDSMNDYEIVRMVGCGCAMANGRPALKAVADRVVGYNYEHAVQAEMRRILSEQK